MQIFQPTLVSKLICENVAIKPGESVLDLGCGTGVIGLEMASRGAIVTASDIMPQACEATRKAGLNAVVSDLFENITGKFDKIINDVSGICESVARVSPWYPEPIPTGGFDGSETVCRMLEQAKDHLNENGILYLPVSSLSNTQAIWETANRHFKTKLIFSKWIPFCKELEAGFEQIKNAPIHYIKRGSRHLWLFELYKCVL